jgi:hypothetical protein
LKKLNHEESDSEPREKKYFGKRNQ